VKFEGLGSSGNLRSGESYFAGGRDEKRRSLGKVRQNGKEISKTSTEQWQRGRRGSNLSRPTGITRWLTKSHLINTHFSREETFQLLPTLTFAYTVPSAGTHYGNPAEWALLSVSFLVL